MSENSIRREGMEEVIQYLELKNTYYEKFFSVTRKFLEQTNENRWDEIEFFVDNRERILSIIRYYDHKIEAVFNNITEKDDLLNRYKITVEELMEKRSKLAEKIVNTDLELISKIDEMKNDTIKELKRVVESSQQVNTFTSLTEPKTKNKTTREA